MNVGARHAVRLHAAGRRAHVRELRRRVLKIDGEVGNKKTYDPRAWSKLAERADRHPHRREADRPAINRQAEIVAAEG